ncbi:hypothetical protein [Photobacterium galatheae]|uniref:Uncharacterized protein n=1 Tax=Photobacterium galatheae TaxID=1654360 RepID=A0A066RKF4_9GAMM|nr:hypothetical protein [Photobacterium galatheae]KDM90814.1 hypothetical protein EA58_13720 [Photobacterium galatheae]MCM0149218.1 hypothetical protein [Photobacterium galatheae]
MLGISKYKKLKKLSDKQTSALVASATKAVSTGGGKTIDVIYCHCCNLPVFEDDAFIGQTEDSADAKILCGLCYYPRNLDMVRFSDSGTLIFAPDLTQTQVSSLALVMYYAKSLASESQDMMDLISDVEDLILRRSEVLNTGICHGASTPSIVCQFMYMMDESDYEERGKLFDSVRLFPSEKLASRQLAYLSTNVLKKYHPDKWGGFVQAMGKQIKASSI